MNGTFDSKETAESKETAGTNQEAAPRWKTWAVWTVSGLLALVFFAAGTGKLVGAEQMVAVFAEIGAGQWFRYLTGLLEIAGALLVLWPAGAFAGAALLACVMAGAIITHLAVIGGSAVPASVLLLLALALAWLRRPGR